MESNYEKFKRVASQYEGVISDTEENIEITANNEIASYYESGEVHTKKVVPCVIGYRKYGTREVLYGHEKTYEILGGFSTGFNEERFSYYLKRYNFKKKQATQLSMF